MGYTLIDSFRMGTHLTLSLHRPKRLLYSPLPPTNS
nr:MAG TPA: hypothetical protein [Caudoviricetes sp.]